MDIETALDTLGGFITLMFDKGAISREELEEIEKAEDAIHAYVVEKEGM